MSTVTTLEDIKALKDEQLFVLLKENNLHVGPVTSTTRSIYEKKLIKYFKENKRAESSFNKSMVEANTPEVIAEEEMRVPVSPPKKSPKALKTRSQPDDDIIITHEEKNISLNPSIGFSGPSKTKNSDSLLDFKLIRDEDVRDISPRRQMFGESPRFDDYSSASYIDSNPITSKSILINRNPIRNQPQMYESPPPKQRINWSSDVGQQGSSLYNAPAPPSPFQKQGKSVANSQDLVSSWFKVISDNLKILAIFLILACVIYFFIVYLQSYNQENPLLEN